MDELVESLVLEPSYTEPDLFVQNNESFDIDYYKSHYVPVRVVIELKQAKHE